MTDTLSRQWQTLTLLPRAPKSISTSDLLAKLMGAGYTLTRRTLERDLLWLQSQFAIVDVSKQRPQLWAWDAAAPPLLAPRLSSSEALTLLMAQQHLRGVLPASTLAHLQGYFDLAAQCLDPTTQQSLRVPQPELRWRDKVRVLPNNQTLLAPAVNATVLATLQEALLQGEQCEICYHKRMVESVKEVKPTRDTYPIHPLGLVQRGTLLYVVCTIKDYLDLKLLAMHRISRAAPLKSKVVAPVGFDLDDYIASGALDWRSDSETIALKVVFTTLAGEHLRETPLSKDQTIAVNGAGELLIKATVQWTPQLEWWLLGFGAGVTVMSPAGLRQSLANTALQMVSNYAAS